MSPMLRHLNGREVHVTTSNTVQLTDFTMDVLGRYMCNGLDEAMRSADKNGQRPDGSPQNDARPFKAVIIGGGSFGGILAQHLLYADETNSYRILVLEAGRSSLPEHFQNLPLQRQPPKCGGFLGITMWPVDFLVSQIRSGADLYFLVGGRRGYL